MTLLEVCVDSAETLRRAESGGAHRIELCARLDLGGLSPDGELLSLARRTCSVPLHVMVRPRGGDFVYETAELARMRDEIEGLDRFGVAGVVFGALRRDRSIDLEATRKLVGVARPLSVTFHRAFDDTPDPSAALEQLIDLGVQRVLTTGGAVDAHTGRFALARLVAQARGRIVVLAGGGVRAHNWRELVRDSGVTEIHSSTVFNLDG